MGVKQTPIVQTTRFHISDRVFRILLALAAFTFIIGATWLAALQADGELRANLLQQAKLVATSLNPQQVFELKGTTADLTSPDYLRLKEQLTRIRLSNPDCRFIYLMSRRSDGTIVLHVDSEPADSKDYSPPGQVYTEAPGKLHDVFATGQAAVRGPYGDRWGTWVSAFVPLPNPATPAGKTVLGMDIAASAWIWTVALRAVPPAALVAVAVLLGLFATLLHRSRCDIRAQQKVLRESEEKYRLLFDYSPLAHIYFDDKGVIIACNDNLAHIVSSSREALLGLNLLDIPDKNLVSAIRKALNGGIGTFEGVYYSQKGEKKTPVRALFTPVKIGEEKILGGVGIIEDITDRMRTEEALRQSEASLHSIFKATPVGISIVKGHVFQRVNKAWCNILGYSESEIIGHDARFLFEDDAEYERVGQKWLFGLPESGIASIQTKHRRKDGVLRDVILTAAPLAPEAPSGETVVAVEDITDRMQTEKALRDNRRQLYDIIEFLPDATLVIDRNGRVITWNREIEILTGIRKEDMIGKNRYQYAIPFYGESRPILVDYALNPDQEPRGKYTAIQRTGDILFGEAFTPYLPVGDMHMSGKASVLRDDKGEIVAAIECIRNNTERKRLEERLKRAEKMEALGTLAGGVAHDLNNVLGVMVGYSELLLVMLPQESPMRKYADYIMQSSIKGAAIIQDLLTLARRGVIVSEIVNLNQVIHDYFKSPEFEKMIAYHPGVKISMDLEEGLLNLKGSPIHLSKMVMNLVSNAAEAISGPGEVTIRTENRHLDQPIRGYEEMKEGDYLVLTVSDTGKGISAEDLGKIFEPFYTKKVMGRSGTGLGLPVVWGTVKDHRGHIDVQSEEGKGSSFILYFPVTREEPARIVKGPSPVSYQGKGETILVVDDVKEQRELAMNMLGKLGYRVEAAAGGEEAIEYLKEKKADLVVLDMIMDPGIDGMETYRRIREFLPGQKALIVSGFSETDRVHKAQEMGAGVFIRKPYILEKIGLAVRQELDRKG